MSPLNKKSGISFFQLLELLHTEVGKDETHLCQYGIIIISLCGFWSSAQVGKSEKSLAVKPDTYSCVIVELWQRRYSTAGQGNRKLHRLDEKTQLQKRSRSFFLQLLSRFPWNCRIALCGKCCSCWDPVASKLVMSPDSWSSQKALASWTSLTPNRRKRLFEPSTASPSWTGQWEGGKCQKHWSLMDVCCV